MSRKEFFRSIALVVVPPIGTLLIRFIYLSSKKRFHLPENIPEDPVIFAFWHGDLLMQPYLYYKFRKKPYAQMLISDHFDGKIIAKIITYFRLGTIHGSTTRNAVKVLINAIRSLKAGYDIGITPDGPRGPRHEVADGIIMMAQKTKAKVIVFSCVPSKYTQLGSWDRFTVPKPFGTLDFYASEPLTLEGMGFEEARALVKEKLLVHDF
ncbi:MAG: hypothetical protein B5M52_02755 [Helicobacteraceae bacterium 4484_230]|nr:MAG: hypothetical protein B5M52_02755 [Helicobacteraceae bacterium 4484_230]